MKKMLSIIAMSLIFYNPAGIASKYSSNFPRSALKMPSTGRTHDVRSYFKKDGTFVKKHRAGNPNSGVHCKNNICS